MTPRNRVASTWKPPESRTAEFRLSARIVVRAGDAVRVRNRTKGRQGYDAVFEYAEDDSHGDPFLCVREMVPVRKNGLVVGTAFAGYRFVRPAFVTRSRS